MNQQFYKAESFWKGGGVTLSYECGPIMLGMGGVTVQEI